ncbi:MAG: YIP1 family protein [Acidobacteriota bacterium]
MEEQPDASRGLPPAGGAPLPPVEADRVSLAGAMVGLLTEPTATFKRLAARPTWTCLVPLVLALVLGAAGYYVFTQRADMKEFMRSEIRNSPFASQMDEKQIEEATQQAADRPPWFMVGTIPVVGAIMMAIIAGVFWVAILAFGDHIPFKYAFQVVCWAQVPAILGTILFIVIINVKDPTFIDLKNPIMTNLGAVLGRDRLGKPLYALLSDLDLFSFWKLWLEAAGFAAFAKARAGKMLAIVFGIYGLYVLGHMALAAIF